MLLYMLGGKVKGRNRRQGRIPRSKSPKNFYPVDPPQEFDDEPGKELGPDAQVWKTYVKETDQVDGELVDGWNKSMDVILIFAALFSAISTAFVIESYKNLKQDPADISAQTLLIISQTLAGIANGSQVSGTQPPAGSQLEAPPFSVPCLSVAVSLISMLAKEWCITFMAGRIGTPGAQARRRQQRWEALLLFAIGLCVFLWDVHFGVAIPVIFVTTAAAGAYFACTILPFLDNYCPYGTVLSMMYKRFTDSCKRTTHDSNDTTQDEITANALGWMIENCETPRSVDVALQSLAGRSKGFPQILLVRWDVWTLIKRRLGSEDVRGQNVALNLDSSYAAHARALQAITDFEDEEESEYNGLHYGSRAEAGRLEVLTLGLQSCIDR
ncbi:hypothetical protein RSOLAG22IIIB_12001 [Rhizoctonia solani]|uniref:DUF6535 domain-containing protein n=1 Tax=Rhizoctonia solani TaxID=456999 RepID=A0A0K6GB12_9AGAM|nr:hypothetical protein RSOLAG22IIIB_12001 [Rhizoctonia solani]